MKKAALLVGIYWLVAVGLVVAVGYIVVHIGWYVVPVAVPFLILTHGLFPRLYISLKKDI